jgi:uncharacterized protein YndB with AHSA1/START domain
MTATSHGRIVPGDGRPTLRITRTFRAPLEDVWAAVTEPDRLARWIGTWTGDPTTGRVDFTMTAEDGAPTEDMEIRECDPPRRLALTAHVGEDRWLLEVALEETDGVTTLTFSQPDIDPEAAESVGPGWEYYLDRLVAAETGGDVAAIDFGRDYYPALQEHYRREAADARG